ncbi:MAG: hypothetical protein CR993_05140 [Rhodobacterales bacterium]|nr:MAG: hypothetical protein CR993_05140 [Rhodobacterales bacterium]
MRKALGALVLVGGVAGLGLWGNYSHGVRMESKITQEAKKVVASYAHPLDLQVVGRDIHGSGVVNTQGDLDKLDAALNDVNGRRVVDLSGITVLPKVDPYETALAKGADGSMASTGYAPSVRAATDVGHPELTLAYGAAEGWGGAVAAGEAALGPLNEGSFTLTGTTLTLNGIAATNAEADAARAALKGASGDYERVVALEVLDPGIVEFDVTYDAGKGFMANGTVPSRLGATGLAKALGTESVQGDITPTVGDFDGLETRLAALNPALTDLDSARIMVKDGKVRLMAVALPGLDADTVAASLKGFDEVEVTVAKAPQDGATRINVLTGAQEYARAGFWFIRPAFDPTRFACTEAAMEQVSRTPILFVTGSAKLDPVSLRVVNSLAGIMHHCTADAGMRVTIGGHTDSQGQDEANMTLSLARAEAVRNALIARGVDAGKLEATGYGEAMPIAPNTTEEGRAKNRRITFDWAE